MIIYKHTSPSGKSYIGCTKLTINERFEQHCSFKEPKTHFQKAIQKYGKDSFQSEILHENINSRDEMFELEKFYINEFDTFNNGYNGTIGGAGGDTQSGTKRSDETKKKISESKSGENHPFYGKSRPEHSDAMKGINNPMYGKENKTQHPPRTQEQKERYRQAALNREIKGNPKRINIYNNKGELMYETYGTFKKTCEEHNLPHAALMKSYVEHTKCYANINKRVLSMITNNGMVKYIGWYAVEMKENM